MHEALLLDVGFVIIDVSWRALEAYERAIGTPMARRESFGDATPTDGYWDGVARASGFDGFIPLFRALAAVVPDSLIDPAAVALMGDTRAAGRRVGVLTNDGYTFIGREFFAGRPEFAELDAFVDAADIGVRKPDPAAYLRAARELDVAPQQIVFLDDTPECVEGAVRVGMTGVLVDPLDRVPAFDHARQLLGLAGADLRRSV